VLLTQGVEVRELLVYAVGRDYVLGVAIDVDEPQLLFVCHAQALKQVREGVVHGPGVRPVLEVEVVEVQEDLTAVFR
jgi:hypothetical protein